MLECPELSVLEREATPTIRDHLGACTSCRLVVELLEERRRGVDARDRRDECARFETLIAARDEGTIGGSAGALLEAHLRECADCRAVAATMPPVNERREHSSLPAVSTAAYALGREVARGGMGRILEALDVRIGRPVAVKELLGKAPSLAARFEREARVTARLQHPGIVPIYEIGRWPDGTPFYAMRMVEGRTLREEIRARPTLDERVALLPSMIAASEAVAFAHGKRIIHRDLTPTNILVGEHGDTVVIDWGLAKNLAEDIGADADVAAGPYRDDPATDTHLTSVGSVIGTAAYMPPEQAKGAAVDQRSDVYSLGAILYHVLAGEPPYRTGKSDEVVLQVQNGPPRTLTEVAAGAPRDLVSIVEKAMAREPAGRYPSARELADELRRFQAGRLVEAHAYSYGERTRRWLRAHRAVVLATAAAAVALAVAGTVGLAGVLRERDRAEEARTKAEVENALLMEEQGRQELVAGNTTRALAWLNEAYKAGDSSPELRFMLGVAMNRVESIVHTWECAGKVQRIQLSPDAKHVMVACQFEIWIGRTSSWERTVAIDTPADGAVYSHDGTLVASWDYSRLSVWEAATGALRLGPIDVGDAARTVHFTPDDRTLVTTSDDAMVRTWDVATGRLRHAMDARSGTMNVVRATITPDGKTILTVTSDGVYRTWEVATGAQVSTFKIPVQPIADDENISPDGKHVLSCGADGSVWINELTTGRTRLTFAAHAHAAMECRYTHDGGQLLTTGLDGTAKVWDVASGRLLSTLNHGGLWVHAQVSPDGERVATIGSNSVLKLWHAASGTLLASLDDPFGLEDMDQLVFSPDGRALISARRPSTVVVVRDFDAGIRSIRLDDRATAQGASPDLSRLAIATPDGAVQLVDTETLGPLEHDAIGMPFAFSRDATRVAAATADGVVVLDVRTGHTIRRVITGKPEMVALDDRGRRLLIAGARSAVWEVDTGQLALDLGKRSDKDSLAPAGDVVLAWSDPREVEVWNVDQRRVQATIRLAHETLGPVGFDAAGRHVIMTEKDDPAGRTVGFARSVLAIHDLATGTRQIELGRSVFSVLDVRRQFLVTSALDGKLGIREASTGKLVSEISSGTVLASGQTVAGGTFVATQDIDSVGIRSSRDGRLLGAIRPVLYFHLTQDSFQAGSPDLVIRDDGRSLVRLGPHPVQWTLPREERSPEEIDRLVRARVRWRVVDGRLLPVTATLHGRVLRRGRPVEGAEIAIQQASLWLHATSGRDGQFEVPSLPYGHYGVIAFAPDRSAKGRHEAMIDRDHFTADFELDDEATVSGEVVDEHQQPVAGVEVQTGYGDAALRATSDARGAFTIRALGAQTYKLFVVEANDGRPTGFAQVGSATALVRDKADRVTGIRLVVRPAKPGPPDR